MLTMTLPCRPASRRARLTRLQHARRAGSPSSAPARRARLPAPPQPKRCMAATDLTIRSRQSGAARTKYNPIRSRHRGLRTPGQSAPRPGDRSARPSPERAGRFPPPSRSQSASMWPLKCPRRAQRLAAPARFIRGAAPGRAGYRGLRRQIVFVKDARTPWLQPQVGLQVGNHFRFIHNSALLLHLPHPPEVQPLDFSI